MNNIKNDINLREAVRRREQKLPPMPEDLNEKVMNSLSLGHLHVERGLKRRMFPLSWRGVCVWGSLAASILIAFLLWPKGDEAPITQPEKMQPVVAKASPVPSQGGVNIAEAHQLQSHKPSKPLQPQQPQQLAAEAQSTPLLNREGLEESLQAESLPLLAEAQITPAPLERDGERLEEILPPDRQALIDIYLAEEALQVAYMQQEQTQELRAFTARIKGKEPETSHLITSF